MVCGRDSLSTSLTHSKTPEGAREGNVKTRTKNSKCKGPTAEFAERRRTSVGEGREMKGDTSLKSILQGKGFGSD